MSSEFDQFAAEFASPAMVEQFGERDEQGELNRAAVVITLPGGRVIESTVIASGENVNDVGGFEGTIRPMAQRMISIPIAAVKGGLRIIPLSSSVFFDGADWEIANIGHGQSGNFIDLQLENPRPRTIGEQVDSEERYR